MIGEGSGSSSRSRTFSVFRWIRRLPGQSVYSKALFLYVTLSLLLGIAVVYLTSSIITGQFLETERQEMVSTIQRFAIVLARESRPVEISLRDLINADNSSKSAFVTLPDAARLKLLQLDFISVCRMPNKEETTSFAGDEVAKVLEEFTLWTHWVKKQSAASGLITIGDQLAAIAWRTLPNGDMIAAGRLLETDGLVFLEGVFGAKVSFLPMRGVSVIAGEENPLLALLTKNDFVVETRGPNELVGHMLVRGINGEAVGQVTLTQGRPLYLKSLEAVQVFLAALTLAGGALFLIIWFLLDRTILARIRTLIQKVEESKRGGLLPLRLALDGNDELTDLAHRIEELATQLESAQADYRAVVEDQTEIICRFDRAFLVTFSNEVFRRVFEPDAEAILFLHRCIPVDCFRILEQHSMALTATDSVSIFLSAINLSSGESRWFRSTLRGTFNAEGNLCGGQWVAADITPQIQAQQNLEASERQLRALSAKLLRIQDDERRRIARELHDSTAQSLAALEMNMSLLEPLASDSRTSQIVAETRQIARDCCLELRTISYLLHPPLLDEVGLAFALRWFCDGFSKRTSIPINLAIPQNVPRLPVEAETTLFRVTQEALSNIYRHAGASAVWITLSVADEVVSLEIRDNGSGFTRPESESGASGVGVAGMRERLAHLGGKLEIRSSPYGVSVIVSLDCNQTHAD